MRFIGGWGPGQQQRAGATVELVVGAKRVLLVQRFGSLVCIRSAHCAGASPGMIAGVITVPIAKVGELRRVLARLAR